MLSFLAHLPDWITTIAIVVPAVIVGGLAIVGFTDRKAEDRKKERTEAADALQVKVDRLTKEAAEIQDQKIAEQAEQLKLVGERLATLEGENKTFRSLLTGADDQSKNYRKRVEATLTLVDKLSEVISMNEKKTDTILTETKEGFNKIIENIERLAQAIEKRGVV